MLIPTVSINTHTEQSRLSFIVSWFDDAPFVSNGAPNKANYPVVSALCVQCVPQPLAERFSIAHNSCALEKATGCSAIIPSGKTISTSIPPSKKKVPSRMNPVYENSGPSYNIYIKEEKSRIWNRLFFGWTWFSLLDDCVCGVSESALEDYSNSLHVRLLADEEMPSAFGSKKQTSRGK